MGTKRRLCKPSGSPNQKDSCAMITQLKKYFPALLLSVCCLTFPSVSFGARCLSPSPTSRAGKNPYAPIVARDLSPAEQQMVRHLFKSLVGSWHGRARSFFCSSADDPSDVERDRETIRAGIRLDDDGNLCLNANFYSQRNHAGRQEVLTLYLVDHRLRIDHDTGAGDVQLIEVSAHTIAFLFRRVLPVGSSGSLRQEYFFTLRADGDSFSIEQQLYVQGKLSSGQTWRFERG
jgi:hypothetical protein